MLPLRPFKIIAKDAKIRLSSGAAKEVAHEMSEWAFEVAQRSVKLANHAGRKTVTGKDVQFALLK
jgi:histone H3/H4